MNDNEYLNNQKQIFHDLLEATIPEYSMIPGKDRGDITIGAHGTVLSFRNSTKGVLAGVIARSVLPEADDITPDRVTTKSALSLRMRAAKGKIFISTQTLLKTAC